MAYEIQYFPSDSTKENDKTITALDDELWILSVSKDGKNILLATVSSLIDLHAKEIKRLKKMPINKALAKERQEKAKNKDVLS